MPCLRGQLADGADVGHRDRLPARHVHRGRQADIGDALGADLADERFQGVEVDVAFEGMFVRRIVGFGDDDVDERAAGQLLVQPRGGEVHVARARNRPA